METAYGNNNIVPGKVYKDQVTGIEGIAIGATIWAYGCVTVGLARKGLDKEGKIYETEWFDEDRLILVPDKPAYESSVKTLTGGPENMGPGEVNR